ncbi:MAG: TonB-dependent receptor [Prevotella sp.]|nr:TonB-dependent receptor [Prevotella sp.]
MHNKLKLAVIALLYTSAVFAQTENKQEQNSVTIDESAFTFSESQLGEDDNVAQEVTVLGSSSNAYANEVGYKWSPARFKFRAFNSKYNDIYINGNPANDAERGEFRYSLVGGLNNQTRSVEASLPFEDNSFAMPAMGGSNNYNFRPSSLPVGHRLSVAGANRNYTFRGMYSYNSGFNDKGWAWSLGLTYRYAHEGYVEGTFYNALSYFLGTEKLINDKHSVSLVTWGNPTERGAQAASTDEMYWIANNRFYNPNWGYQNGKKRNSRIIHDFAPSALMTWDWTIDNDTKLTTTLFGKYAMYSSSRLSYNNSTNPAPDYYSTMPSYNYNVWDPTDNDNRTDAGLAAWQASYDYLSASKDNRQINWDRLYFSNKAASAQGVDAMYYLQAYHDDQLTVNLASSLKKQLTNTQTLNSGFVISTNKGMHYQTMEDLLGATSFRNLNTYIIGTYLETDPEAQYDANNPNAQIKEGDRFAYDYNIYVNKAQVWSTYAENFGPLHYSLSARLGGQTMQREGNMRNGLALNNSYGKSKTAKFIDGGFKFGSSLNAGRGNAISFGIGFEKKAPVARTAFSAPQINNDFVKGLKNEDVFSTELGYQLETSWVHANINAFYSRLAHVAEYSMYYDDSQNSFSYVSINGIKKHYYGVEAGLNFKISSSFNIKALGTISEAEYINDADVTYTKSQDGKTYNDVVLSKGMREGCTPLTAGSIDLNYHAHGWFLDLIGNYYDRIYLYYTPVTRYASENKMSNNLGENVYNRYSQAKGDGGFMLDASIGRSIYLKRGSLSINLMLTNILNNTNIVTGGMEQNRKDRKDINDDDIRAYKFQKSPKKFYANGTNGMLIVTYKF